MNAPGLSSVPTFANCTPVHIGAAGLIVRDIDRLTAFYRDLLGLSVHEQMPGFARLGVCGTTLLELTERPDALADDVREAGLYHTAFLMPTRADMASWILHAARNRIPITGASDHDVSEAIYLDDPEGNGVEIYSDRSPETWRRDGKTIFQKTDPIDIDAIISEIDPATSTFDAAPDGLRIGHIHLRVGDIGRAEEFYCGALGLDVTRRRGGATFFSSAGYHHHVAANTWHSDGAGTRNGRRGGLDWFAMEINNQQTMQELKKRLHGTSARLDETPDGFATSDPWGTRIQFSIAR